MFCRFLRGLIGSSILGMLGLCWKVWGTAVLRGILWFLGLRWWVGNGVENGVENRVEKWFLSKFRKSLCLLNKSCFRWCLSFVNRAFLGTLFYFLMYFVIYTACQANKTAESRNCDEKSDFLVKSMFLFSFRVPHG